MEISLGHVVSAHRLGASVFPRRPATLSSLLKKTTTTATDHIHPWFSFKKKNMNHMMMTTTTKSRPSWPSSDHQLSTKQLGASKFKQAAAGSSELIRNDGGREEVEQDQQYLVERLELLEEEEEAIIGGGDQGRDPTDYNRRARVFDQCSKAFQALKDEEQQQENTHHCHR